MPEPVLLIDLDDTLIPDVPAARQAVADTLRCTGRAHDAAAVDELLRVARERWRGCPHRELPELARVSSWEALWLDPAAPELPEQAGHWLAAHTPAVWGSAAASDLFRTRRAELVRPLPEVPARLAELGARHELWLATEGAASLQRRKVALAGLTDHFSRILVSAEVGCSKGDPAFATTVRQHLDTIGSTLCQVVGDSAGTDLALARHGGWPALHICEPTDCAVSTAGVRHGQGIGAVLRWCRCPAGGQVHRPQRGQ